MKPGWLSCTVADIAAPTRNAIVGGPFGSDLVSRDYVESGVPVIRGANMGLGRWVTGEFVFVTPEKSASLAANHAEPGDLVFTQRGTIGQVALVPPGSFERYLVSQSQMKLTVDPKRADPLFVYYVFRSSEQQEYIRQNAIQTGVPHTNLSLLKSTPLQVPSLGTQRAIARILGALDDKIELNRRTNETLEAMARALFQSWFVDFDPVRAKMEGRQPEGMDAETARLFPSTLEVTATGELPRGWTSTSLYDCATWVNGAAYRDFQFCETGQGLPIIKIAELKSGITGQTRFTLSNPGDKYRIDTGDVLFSWSGNPDTSIDTFIWTRGPAWLNQHIFKVLPPSERERTFLICLLRSLKPLFADIARNKQTTGLGHVTAGDMKRLQVPRPSDDIRDAFDRVVGPILGAIDSCVLSNQALEELRDTLLPKLLSGELRVPEAEKAVSAVL